jgi:hypothetical protein
VQGRLKSSQGQAGSETSSLGPIRACPTAAPPALRRTVPIITPVREEAMAIAKHTTATVIPALQYQDAPAVIDFLCKAFGGPRLDFRQLRCLG